MHIQASPAEAAQNLSISFPTKPATNVIIVLTFKFISGEEGSKTILQGYYWTPKPARDTWDNKPETSLKKKKEVFC